MVHDRNEAFAPSLTLCGCKAFFQGLNQTGIGWFLCCSVSLLPSEQGILVASDLCEATATPPQQSFLANALERLWRRQDDGKVVAIHGTIWPFSLSFLQPSQCVLCPVTSGTFPESKISRDRALKFLLRLQVLVHCSTS